MKRNITEKINEWYNSGTYVPLLIYGPRGTGKTYTVLEFAQSECDRYIYINFEADYRARLFFTESNKNITEIIIDYFGLYETDADEVVFVFDEIEACPALLSKFTSNDDLKVKIICLSSFIPAYYKKCFTCLQMAPMTFDEYLSGIGKEWYREVAEGHYMKKKPVPGLVHEELLELYYDYLKTGGMPEVINEVLNTDSLMNVEERQRMLLNAVLNDLDVYGDSEHYDEAFDDLLPGDSKKMKEIISVIPKHVGTDKQKFTFNLIRRGVTYNMYSNAITQLVQNGIIIKSQKYEEDSFRLSLFDFGLLSYCLKNIGIYTEDDLNEKLVRSNLVVELAKRCKVFFWESKYSAKVDCIFEQRDVTVPVEVNISSHRKSKSINLFCENVKIAYVVYVGEYNYNIRDNVVEMPLYLLHLLGKN